LSVTCSRSVVFSTNKSDNHDIAEILLKVALNTMTLTHLRHRFLMGFNCVAQSLVFCVIFCQPLFVIYPLPLAILFCIGYLQSLLTPFVRANFSYPIFAIVFTPFDVHAHNHFSFFFYFPSCWLYMIHNCYME
jgi:hypothetical protein